MCDRRDVVAYFLIVVLLALVVLASHAAVARADGSPSPVPSPSVTPVATPAARHIEIGGAWWRYWVIWRQKAVQQRELLNRARACFGLPPRALVPRRPTGTLFDDWRIASRKWHAIVRSYRWQLRTLRYRMVHPRLTSAYSWRPLVRWHWPAGLVERALWVMRLESGGQPWAVNPSSGAAGLFQLHPAPAGWQDPDTNVRLAYRKYLAQGWRAWVVTW